MSTEGANARSSTTVRWGGGSIPPSKLFEFLMLTPFALPIVPTPLSGIATTVQSTGLLHHTNLFCHPQSNTCTPQIQHSRLFCHNPAPTPTAASTTHTPT